MLTAMQMLLRRLRSGVVTQTTGQLGLPTGERCSLGVICDIAVEYGVIPPPVATKRAGKEMLSYDGDTESLPLKVRDFFGFQTVGVSYLHSGDRSYHSLMSDNDTLRLTFPEIADTLESRPSGMFMSNAVKAADIPRDLLPTV